MLKALLMIECDDCGQQFLFARTSNYTADALHFNVSVLTAMIRDYDWTVVDREKYHYCRECYSAIAEMQDQLMP